MSSPTTLLQTEWWSIRIGKLFEIYMPWYVMSASWHKWMHQVAASTNSSLHLFIGDTLHYIIFGQDKRPPCSILLQKEKPIYSFDGYILLRIFDFPKTYKRIQQNMESQKRMSE